MDQKITITRDFLRSWIGPMVYAFYRKSRALYVGSSRHGLERITSPNHKYARLAYRECDRLEITICTTYKLAMKLEQQLIRKEGPKYNKRTYHPEMEAIALLFDRDTHRQLVKMASSKKISKSALLRQILREHVMELHAKD